MTTFFDLAAEFGVGSRHKVTEIKLVGSRGFGHEE
jgi:hypothetical protein